MAEPAVLQVRNALEAATALAAMLGLAWGEVTLQVVDHEPVLVRHLRVYKPADLEKMTLPGVQSG